MLLEEDHDGAHRALLLPRLRHRVGAARAQPRHLGQPLGRAIEHFERGQAERLHDALRVRRPDARHHPRAEVALQPLQRGGHDGEQRLDLELLTVAWIFSYRPVARTRVPAGADGNTPTQVSACGRPSTVTRSTRKPVSSFS